MNQEILQELKNWFTDYVSTYKTGKTDNDGDIILKEEHTKRVCQEMLYIGENLELTNSDLQLAEVMALFHDIGRFEQYAQYGTFADRVSVNHAKFGVQILKEKQTLHKLSSEDQELIFRAITYHNRQFLPGDEKERCLYFSKMLRDADKLDIWKLFTDSYIDGANLSKAVIHGLQDTPGISDALYNDLIRGKAANYADAKNLNDFKLLQTGWVYDVNFVPTFRRIHEQGYLTITRNALPQSAQIDELFRVTESYLKAQIQNVK